MQKIEIQYKTNFFSRERRIVFSKESLNIYSGDELLVQIEKEDIKECRYGIKWIRGIDFNIGRLYCVDIGNGNDKLLKIRLRSLYGVNKGILSEKFNSILDKLYDFYLNEKIERFLYDIENGVDVPIGGVTFKKEGVLLDSKKMDGFIEWNDLNTSSYTYYYTLSSKRKPTFYKAFIYVDDWNAVMVFSISRQILINKGLFNI